MIELLNSKVVRVAMAMAAFTAGCAAPADDASDVDMDEAEAVEVEEVSQAFTGCDPLRAPFRHPISSLRNCGGGYGGYGGWGSYGGGNWGGGYGGWGGGYGNWGGGYGNWGGPGSWNAFSPCSGRPGGYGPSGYGWGSPFGSAYPGAWNYNKPC
jgi:hypothetical protein